ncbi:GNAT family N-acetyltransferase [Rhizobium sp. SGZ-381]|uniref:GNAT family N-acetyltransferase n=1 Tax=Rhizobium sp. SGZ-381 TaxID=3342800 RepID=UPI00366C59E6
MVTGLTIRDMATADHQAVAEIGFAAWMSSDAWHAGRPDETLIAHVKCAFDAFPAEAPDRITVAAFDGQIVGWAALNGDKNHISDLWVHPQHQSKGIGRALIDTLLQRMIRQGISRVTIHTHASNSGAIRLYERLGFRIVWRGMEFSKSAGTELEKVHMEKGLG